MMIRKESNIIKFIHMLYLEYTKEKFLKAFTKDMANNIHKLLVK